MKWEEVRQTVATYFAEPKLVRGFQPEDILKLSSDSRALYLAPIDWTWGSDDKDIQNKLEKVKTQYDCRCNQVEALTHEAGMLIERALGDLLKYDELNVERFKVVMEFVEFDRMYPQQLAEQNDTVFWEGLITEAEKSAAARIQASGNVQDIRSKYDAVRFEYDNAANHTTNQDVVGRGNARGARNSSVVALTQYEAQVSANELDSVSHLARKNYEERSRIHQIERREINGEIIKSKLIEFMKPNGALNYRDRMIEISERSYDDFVEVLARLHAIVLGLREFYSVENPSEVDLENDLANSRTRIEGAVKWLRRAANAFARARMNEQGHVVRLTVQPESGGALLQELAKGKVVGFPADLIANMTRAQLRGISATAEPLSGDAWIDLEITCPEQKLASANVILPPITSRLGRVSSSESLNVRDFGGGRPIINRSPVGDWKIQAVTHNQAVRHDRAEQINRVHVDFHLVSL